MRKPIGIACICVAAAAGVWCTHARAHDHRSGTDAAAVGTVQADQAHGTVLDLMAPLSAAKAVWTCPMHPAVVQDHPGRCPICGMDLVQKHAHSASSPTDVGTGHDIATAGNVAANADHKPDVTQTAPSPDAKPVWICPMHPNVVQDHPGRCPICGMDLVQKHSYAKPASAGAQVDAAIQQRLGIQLVSAKVQPIARVVKTYGTVALNERSFLTVTPKVEGWIKSLHVVRVGQAVKAAQVLYDIYSPDLVQRQREYLELLQRRDRLKDTDAEIAGQTAQVVVSLVREIRRAQQKLRQADVSDEILDEIERTGRVVEIVPVRAEKPGFVTKINVRTGAYVNPASALMDIAAEGDVRIDVSLHQSELMGLAEGDSARVTVPNAGSKPLRARVIFGSPSADELTRTFPVQLLADDAQRILRPGMSVDVEITGKARDALVVPYATVLHGGDGARVMVAEDGGHFKPTTIVTGLESNGFVEVADGLQPGTEVAANGQFLLDAAASMNDAAYRMSRTP